MEYPLISVIVPVYKVESYLTRCVQSLQAQTYPNLEIYLVDDGSPDRCGAMCEEFAAADPRIHVIHKENGGLSSARNAGIDVAQGEYLGFVDSDDWVEPDFYEQLYAAAAKFDAPMAYCGRLDEESETLAQTVGLCPEREEAVTGEEFVRRVFCWENVDSAAWDKLYRRELFREIRYPLGVIGEDVPTTYRLALLGGRVAACPKPLYHYYHRPDSITTSLISQRDFRYVENVMGVERDIRQNWPQLEEPALYLKIRTIAKTLQALEVSDSAVQEKFSAQSREYRSQLRHQAGFVMKSRLFSPKERRDFLLMAFGLYQLPRTVYHAFKGR